MIISRIAGTFTVCLKWRDVAINSPDCWSKISVDLDASLNYVRGFPFGRQTKARAIQESLSNYLSWAKNQPVELTCSFSRQSVVDTRPTYFIGFQEPSQDLTHFQECILKKFSFYVTFHAEGSVQGPSGASNMYTAQGSRSLSGSLSYLASVLFASIALIGQTCLCK
jgi:hypothetical protein